MGTLKQIPTLILVCFSLLIQSCSGATPSPVIQIEQSLVSPTVTVVEFQKPGGPVQAVIPGNVWNIDPVIPDTTNIISKVEAPITWESVKLVGDTLIFSETALEQEGVAITDGDMLVIDPNEGLPYGVLRRVIGVSTDGSGNLLAETVPAALVEAIQSGEAHISEDLREIALRSPSTGGGGVQAKAIPNSEQIQLQFNPEDFGAVTVDPDLIVKPAFDFDLVIEDWKVKWFYFQDRTTVTGKLSAKTNYMEAGFEGKTTLAEIPLDPIAVKVLKTPFLIWLNPVLKVYLGANGDVSAGVTTSVEQDVTFNTAVFYPNQYGDFNMIFKPKLGKTHWAQPTFYSTAELRVYIRPELMLKVFEFDGPYAGVDFYVRLAADPFAMPTLELFWGLECTIGVQVKAFSYELLDWEAPVCGEEWPLPVTLPQASDTPTPTFTPTFTSPPPVVFTPTPTFTWIPPALPTSTQTPPIPAPDGTDNVLMTYNDLRTTLINVSGAPISVVGVSFKRISDQGVINAEFDSNIWVALAWQPISRLTPNDCLQVAVKGNVQRPGNCEDLWGFFESSQADFYFWVPIPGSRSFQVIKNGQVVQTCDIQAGRCSFYLPQP